MIVLDILDRLEGKASVAAVVKFTCSVLEGREIKSSEGTLGTAQTEIWQASAATQIISLTLVNTHSSAVVINVQKKPKNKETLYNILPDDLSLGIGYMAVFGGQKLLISTTTGTL